MISNKFSIEEKERIRKMDRSEMLPAIITLLNTNNLHSGVIIKQTGITSINILKKRHSGIYNMKYETVCRLYECAILNVGLCKFNDRVEMLSTIITLLDNWGISTTQIIEKTKIKYIKQIRNSPNLLLSIPISDYKKLYNFAEQKVGYRPSKEKMIGVIKKLFLREDIKDYEVKIKTGLANYNKDKLISDFDTANYDTLYKLYKFELALQEDQKYEVKKRVVI